MLARYIETILESKLQQASAVVLLGPRQIGKTTLAQHFVRRGNAVYLDLESPEDLLKLEDPISFFRNNKTKLVVLDEVQRTPDIFNVLRGIIDKNREEGYKVGQFLLLGSASMDLLRQSAESLAGRMTYLEMSGLNILEIDQNRESIKNLWMRGGFPESYLATSDSIALEWVEDLIRTYVERDVPHFGFRVPASRLRRLWTMLAHLQGENINYSTLATNLEVDSKTITHYLDILADLLLVRRLNPWYTNVKKRLVKSPRYYVRDSGITHRLLNIRSYNELLSNPILGKSWEAFVIENIHSVLPFGAETYFYRTAAGAEIDLVIKLSLNEIWAVEIKHGVAPKLNKNYSETCNDVGATHKYVIYGGNDEFSVGNGVVMTSLEKFLRKLAPL